MAASPLAAALLGEGGGGVPMSFLDPNIAAATPDLQLGQAMIQQGLSTAPASPWQALARVAQAGAGTYLQHDALSRLAQAYAQTPASMSATLPDGHPLKAALNSPDPVVRMQAMQAYPKAMTLLSEPSNIEPGGQRFVGSKPIAENTGPQSPEGKLQRDIDNRRQAIAGIESGGNYATLGPVTRSGDRAYGKYQVMGANIGPWTKEVLGKQMTPQQFLNDPAAQDQVFDAKFGQYAQKYGPTGAAKAWFAGEGGMNNPNAKDQLGTSVASYARQFDAAGGAGKTPPTQVPANPLQGAIETKAAQGAAEEAAKNPVLAERAAATKANEELYGGASKALGNAIGDVIEGGGKNARDRLNAINTIEDALKAGGKGISTGPFAENILRSKEALDSFGIDTSWIKKGLPESEVISKMNAQLASASAKAMTGRPTQFEFSAWMKNNPGLLTSKEGTLALTNVLKQAAQQDIDLGKLAQNKANWEKWGEVVDKYYKDKPLISPFTHKPMAEATVPAGGGTEVANAGPDRAALEAEMKRRGLLK